MKNLVFLNDNIINKEIAFVLGMEFKLASKKRLKKSELYYVSNEEEEDYLESKGYKYEKNYVDFDYILDFLDGYNKKRDLHGRKDYYTTNKLKITIQVLCQFYNCVFLCCCSWVVEVLLYILDFNSLSDFWFSNVLSHFVSSLFTFLTVYFDDKSF